MKVLFTKDIAFLRHGYLSRPLQLRFDDSLVSINATFLSSKSSENLLTLICSITICIRTKNRDIQSMNANHLYI